jgi:hypothetical protein
MKTAQIMNRDLHGFSVRQNHKTGMFNANDLLDAHNESHPKSPKRLDVYLKTNSTMEYLEFLERKSNSRCERDLKSEDQQLLFSGLKVKRPTNVIKTSRGRVNGGTWMTPNLFLDFAMWLSVEFKDWAIECAKDRLIQFRDDAGESFKEVNNALSITMGEQRQIEYIREARMINGFVFENGKGGQRNDASEEQLDLLDKLQKADIKMIHRGLPFEKRRNNLEILKDLIT